jgi:plasmid stability protein
MKTIIVRDIPEELHRKLKILAAQQGKSMNAVMLELMQKATN